MSGALRIAWVGPAPSEGGGVAGAANLVLRGLLDRGCTVDCFLGQGRVPEALAARPGLEVERWSSDWRWGKWYSSSDFSALVSGQASRARGLTRIGGRIAERHARQPYDVVYQFSHIELLGLRSRLDRLPPVVLHPGTHAAGELRWFRREAALARRCEPLRRRVAARAALGMRSRVQRRHIRRVGGVICVSRRFRTWLEDDYGIDHRRTCVVPYPIDLDRFRPAARPAQNGAQPVRVVFVGRISVRKGIDCLVELSRRLVDLEGRVVIEIVGNRTLWSDYRALLDGADSRIAVYRGDLPARRIPELLATADVLVQPSAFEPFGLTVAEGLAAGVPAVVTDEVGAAEEVSRECVTVVPVGDVDAFEHAVRELVERVRAGERQRLAEVARSEAERLFEPARVSGAVLDALRELAA